MDTPQPTQASSKNINTCHNSIIKAFPIVCQQWEAAHPGMSLKVDWCYRTPADQFEIFKEGRTLDQASGQWIISDKSKVVTEDDGVTFKSHHNVFPSQAADIYITQDGNILWGENDSELALYVELGKLWEGQGLISGSTWKYSWLDHPHVQVAYDLL
jgi:hypothetical protein